MEVQAQALENLLSGIRLVRPSPTSWLEVLAFMVLATVLRQAATCAAWFWRGDVLGRRHACVYWWFCRLHQMAVLFDPLFAIAGNALVLVVLLTAGFAASNRRRRELRAALRSEQLCTPP